jgi:hypothetical protein
MDASTLIGSFGVSLLLLAYFLNLFGFLSQKNYPYVLLNFFGAGLSCYASYLIHYMPFVVLEGLWCLVALVALIQLLLKQETRNLH